MKKIFKSRIFIVIITMLICISGTLYATTSYKASEILYNTSNGELTNVEDALNDLYKNINAGESYPSLSFKANATYSTINITSGSMVCDGNILELQLPTNYTNLIINSKKNCDITLTDGLLVIAATGTGNSVTYGNGKKGGPSINFSYDIIVSTN